jgi:hypothetical protein
MWNVILHFNRGSVQTMKFEDKASALKCVEVAVFRNEDCINCSIYKDTQTVVVEDSTQKLLEQIKWKFDLVEKLTGKKITGE